MSIPSDKSTSTPKLSSREQRRQTQMAEMKEYNAIGEAEARRLKVLFVQRYSREWNAIVGTGKTDLPLETSLYGLLLKFTEENMSEELKKKESSRQIQIALTSQLLKLALMEARPELFPEPGE
jgi:hypothetical protein